MKMMTNFFAIPGDGHDHFMVSSQCADKHLACYADFRPDGVLSLLVVNKNPDSPIKTKVQIKGFKPDSSAKGWIFDKDNYQWETDSVPYHADPDKPPTLYSVDDVSKNLVGTSRKRFLGLLGAGAGMEAVPLPVGDRVEASLATAAAAMVAGAGMVRVHDVAATVQVARLYGPAA